MLDPPGKDKDALRDRSHCLCERSRMCGSGRRLKGNVYRLLGPVLLEWVEANEPEKDPENWSSKCVLRWKKKTKQPHPRTK